MLPRLRIYLPRCCLSPRVIAAFTALSPAPPLPYTPQYAECTPMLPTLSLTNNATARPHIWLRHHTGGCAPRPLSQMCTAPSKYRDFTCQNSLETPTDVKIRCPQSIRIQSRYCRKRPSDYMPKLGARGPASASCVCDSRSHPINLLAHLTPPYLWRLHHPTHPTLPTLPAPTPPQPTHLVLSPLHPSPAHLSVPAHLTPPYPRRLHTPLTPPTPPYPQPPHPNLPRPAPHAPHAPHPTHTHPPLPHPTHPSEQLVVICFMLSFV